MAFFYVGNWGQCDDLCKRALNPMIQKYEDLLDHVLETWVSSESEWVRRGSAVCMIRSEKSRYVCDIEFDRVKAVVSGLSQDKNRFVQKATGWLLKAASLKHKKKVIQYLEKNVSQLSRLSFRYATENLEHKERNELLNIEV